MDRKFKIFTINPGSTSTKVALFDHDRIVVSGNLTHDPQKLEESKEIREQYDYRKQAILSELAKRGTALGGLDAVVGRCGGMGPVAAGTYAINELLLDHSMSGRVAKHPANLGAQLAYDFASMYGGKAFIVNPPDIDEFEPIARVCGLRNVSRQSKSHPLNQKEVAIRYAASLSKRYEDLNLVISHMGGGVSVTVHRKGRMVDSTDCMDGDGPMAPTRAGAITAVAIMEMCFSGNYTQREMYDRLTKSGGLADHLGTADVIEIKKRIAQGDTYARLIYDAMIYQTGKYIAAYSAVVGGDVDAILLTGGIAKDSYLVEKITAMVKFIAPVISYAGEFEMEAMAAGAIRVLSGEEEPRTYDGKPVWNGFAC